MLIYKNTAIADKITNVQISDTEFFLVWFWEFVSMCCMRGFMFLYGLMDKVYRVRAVGDYA